MNKFLYIVKTSTDLGFGITGNIKDRAQDYVSHCGPRSGVYHPIVWQGSKSHVETMERFIKTQWKSIVFSTDLDWDMEWLTEDVDLSQFIEMIENELKRKPFLDLKIYKEDYNYLKDYD